MNRHHRGTFVIHISNVPLRDAGRNGNEPKNGEMNGN